MVVGWLHLVQSGLKAQNSVTFRQFFEFWIRLGQPFEILDTKSVLHYVAIHIYDMIQAGHSTDWTSTFSKRTNGGAISGQHSRPKSR